MIVFAEEVNKTVYAYDERKQLIFKHKGVLHNYTEKYIAIKRPDDSPSIDVFDCDGNLVYASTELSNTEDLLKVIVEIN